MPFPRLLAIALGGGILVGAGARVWQDGRERSRGTVARGAVSSGEASDRTAARNAGMDIPMAPPPGAEKPVPETVESILAAEGLEQSERLALFLPTARPADLKRLYLGLEEQRNGFLDETTFKALFLRWMRVDPKGGREYAAKRHRDHMAWWAWGKVDPVAAVAAALATKEKRAGAAVVRAIGQGDPARAQALLDQHPQWRADEALIGLAAGLMRTDPAAGALLVAASDESRDQDKLVSTWAWRDPEAALAWAKALPDQVLRVAALGVLIDQWAKTDPDRIAAALTALPDGRTKWQFYASHAARLAATDPEAALAWAQAAPTEGLRRHASLAAARELAGSDPAAGLDILRGLDLSLTDEMSSLQVKRPDGTDDDDSQDNSATWTVSEIADAAPEATMAFLTGLPTGPATGPLTDAAFSAWMRRDSMAASAWLAGQPAGEVKEYATGVLVDQLSRGAEPDFDAALRWALTLPSGNQQDKIRSLFLMWRQRDAPAARAALDHPGVPAGLRESLSRAFSQP
ncbi:MAG: hypothetical protein ACKV19_08520 [Verrucomicrobiales bacterium]